MELREFPIFRDSDMSGRFVIEQNRILLFASAYKAARFRIDVLTYHSKNLRYLVWIGDTRRIFIPFCFASHFNRRMPSGVNNTRRIFDLESAALWWEILSAMICQAF